MNCSPERLRKAERPYLKLYLHNKTEESNHEANQENCRGGAGFAAFQAVTPVEVQDQSGRVLGDGTLGDGTFEIKGRDPEGETLYTACRFRVAIPLAAEARIYIVRIGGEALVRRLHVSEMHRLKGTVRLTID